MINKSIRNTCKHYRT